MTNKIRLKSISELLGMNFFIPSYQRGYRWDKQQVDDLLDDIYAFANKKGKADSEFYCLQPVVVKKLSEKEKQDNSLHSELDNNDWYEVIDGQQRLTTIRIILTYLVKQGERLKEDYGKTEFILEYETRPDTKSFLENIDEDLSNETIDFYFIYQAYGYITEWFNTKNKEFKPKNVRDSIINPFVHSMKDQRTDTSGTVQIIWYEIKDDTNPIDTFIRINMGKIPLTNAELIKALFLQKRKFEENVNEDTVKQRKNEIANEWDKMEYALQNDDFWWFLNKDKNDIPARIEFLFDLIYRINKSAKKKDHEDFEKKYGVDKYVTFRFFNDKFKDDSTFENIESEWKEIKEYFLAFEEWYNHPVWYHYIGFLIYCGLDVVDIYNLYKGKKKNEFSDALKGKIRKIPCSKENDNYEIDLSYNENKDKEKIRQLLLLFNIEFIVKQHQEIMKNNKDGDSNYFILRFPFELFKKENWDIEHIDSQKPNEKEQIEWLKTAKEDLKNEIDDSLSADIDDFIRNNESTKIVFENLYKRLTLLTTGEEENNEETKHCIGNLTLLNADINRSYGNALFPTKRRIIIEKDMEGKFIPICTKHVFLKYFDKEGTSRTKWGKSDIQNHQNYICKILNHFLTIKQVENYE